MQGDNTRDKKRLEQLRAKGVMKLSDDEIREFQLLADAELHARKKAGYYAAAS